MEKCIGCESHARGHFAWAPEGDSKREPRVLEAVEKDEALLHLSPQRLRDEARIQTEVFHEDLPVKAVGRDGSQKRTGDRVLVGSAATAQNLGERPARAVDLDRRHAAVHHVNPVKASAVLDEFQRSVGVRTVEHPENVAQRGRAESAWQLHRGATIAAATELGPSFGRSAARGMSQVIMLRGVPLGAILCALSSCTKMGPLSDLEAGSASSPWPGVSSNSTAAAPAAESQPTAPATVAAMPPRPVPRSSPTVTVTMPLEVQLKAIQYMASMQAPRADDSPADEAYAQSIAAQLRAVGRTDVVSGGRQIDIQTDKGCTAVLPREAVAHHTGASSLATLLAHGVLVVRCWDRALQCLQSTREADDVLCTRR
jgi:hypothetical protein